MMIKTIKEQSCKVEKIVQALLCDTGFSGFKFDSSFTLIFVRNNKALYNEQSLPWVIEIQLLSDWWFNPKDNWQTTIDKEQHDEIKGSDEPAKAYELTCIRWSSGSVIDNVLFDSNSMTIVFANGKSLTTSFKTIEDYSWIIKESGVNENEAKWSIVCDNGEFFVRMPGDNTGAP